MVTKLNLSSTPFRNRALPWTVTAIVTLFSVIALVFIAKWTFDTNAQAQVAGRDVAQLRQQADALNKRAEEIMSRLSPEQQRALKSTHTLIDRKLFSWSRLFADLESALPGSVRVTRITVKGVRTQDARLVTNLELVVASKNAATVTQMIEEMERQGIFHAELVSQNSERGRGESGQEYEMNVFYAPRAGVTITPSEQNKRPVDTAGEGAGTR
ncbi:MAG TPA: PilN domain-containing protein [Pyrinomonadaceae bacterium]|nr:PilN domain-containing protein [Pyrinomonadaceae bacterium]